MLSSACRKRQVQDLFIRLFNMDGTVIRKRKTSPRDRVSGYRNSIKLRGAFGDFQAIAVVFRKIGGF